MLWVEELGENNERKILFLIQKWYMGASEPTIKSTSAERQMDL